MISKHCATSAPLAQGRSSSIPTFVNPKCSVLRMLRRRDDHRERQFLYSQWVSRESTVITTLLFSAVNLGRISISIISLNFIAMAILAPKAFSYWFSALVNFERFRVIGGNNNSKKTCNQRRAVHRAYIWHSELAWWCPSLETSERIENSPTFHFFPLLVFHYY